MSPYRSSALPRQVTCAIPQDCYIVSKEHAHDLARTVVVDGFEHSGVQFHTVSLFVDESQQPRDHVVLNAFGSRIDVAEQELLGQSLLRRYPHATVSTIVADSTGFSQVATVGVGDPFEVASAVAITKASAAWDESDPIKVAVDGDTIDIHAEIFRDGWKATRWRSEDV